MFAKLTFWLAASRASIMSLFEPGACKALGGSDGGIHSRISDSGVCVRARTNMTKALIVVSPQLTLT